MNSILLGHGSGGRMMHDLINNYFVPAFDIKEKGDAAVLEGIPGGRIAVTTDSYVVSPIFFPGGDIGSLAVNGTINDLSVAGAEPLYITAGFIIEEGFSMDDLKVIVSSMARAAAEAGVKIVAGDTKVVQKGKGDGIFINTSGIGIVPEGVELSASNIKPEDKIIISGAIGSHGIAVMAKRNGLSFEPEVMSDTASLNGLTSAMIKAGGVRIMRDPTRGGLATTLKEFADASGLCMRVYESDIPVPPGVRGACELLGLDPLYVANEGVVLAVTSPDMAEYLITAMRSHPRGKDAVMAGEVCVSPESSVILKTAIGGTRMLDMLLGEQLPRIC